MATKKKAAKKAAPKKRVLTEQQLAQRKLPRTRVKVRIEKGVKRPLAKSSKVDYAKRKQEQFLKNLTEETKKMVVDDSMIISKDNFTKVKSFLKQTYPKWKFSYFAKGKSVRIWRDQ